jgi:hypothetical protein
MTSHIFVALGMWDDVVAANENAVRVQNSMRVEQGLEPRHWGHYNFWLLYGLLQQGRHADAKNLLTEAYKELQAENKAPEDRLNLDPDTNLSGSVVQMWTRYIIETRDWTGDVADWKFKLGDSFDQNLNYSFVAGMKAANEGLASEAGQYLAQFRELKSELAGLLAQKEEAAPGDKLFLDRLAVQEQELIAGIEFAKGESLEAARFAAEASRMEGLMPHSFGPPFVDWPSAELHGEMLLDARKYADAEAAFELQLKRTRQRTSSLKGLLLAQQKQGKDREAAYTQQRLDRILRKDPDSAMSGLPDELEEN